MIACRIFKPYVDVIDLKENQYDIVYLDIQQHNFPHELAKQIQQEIDSSSGYQKIIILYGLCGGALLEIRAREIPLLLIKVHDCLSILLGSKESYEELTKDNKSVSWSCYSLEEENHRQEFRERWAQEYDEETVQYLISTLDPEPSMYVALGLPQELKYIEKQKNIVKGSNLFLQEILQLRSKDTLHLFVNETIKNSLDREVIRKG